MTPELQAALELIDRVRALSYRTDAELFSLCGPSFKVADAYRQSEAELAKAREDFQASEDRRVAIQGRYDEAHREVGEYAVALGKARTEIEALKRDNDRLNKEWGEIKYAYDHAKENGRWHEERNGDAQSELYECESRSEQAESSLKRTEEALGESIRALEKIANADYRGNRSTESQNAFNALARIKALTQDNPPPSAEKKPCGFPERHNNPTFPDRCPDCGKENS